jgi:type I restriction enzyme M protein
MKRHSFFGADQAEGSIQKARINMLLYGEGSQPTAEGG